MGLTHDEVNFYAGSVLQLERQNLDRADAQRRAELSRPLPKVAEQTVQVRVLQPFRYGRPYISEGRTLEAGEVVSLTLFDARSMAAIHRCEIIS